MKDVDIHLSFISPKRRDIGVIWRLIRVQSIEMTALSLTDNKLRNSSAPNWWVDYPERMLLIVLLAGMRTLRHPNLANKQYSFVATFRNLRASIGYRPLLSGVT